MRTGRLNGARREIETFWIDALPAGPPVGSAVRVGDTVHDSDRIGHHCGELRVGGGGIGAEATASAATTATEPERR